MIIPCDLISTFKPISERYLGFWTTAVLGGIDAVIMGHRDKEGRITGVEHLTPEDIWKVISHGQRQQQGIKSRCFQFQFLQKFLDQVKSEFPSSDPEIMKKFEWDPELKEYDLIHIFSSYKTLRENSNTLLFVFFFAD